MAQQKGKNDDIALLALLCFIVSFLLLVIAGGIILIDEYYKTMDDIPELPSIPSIETGSQLWFLEDYNYSLNEGYNQVSVPVDISKYDVQFVYNNSNYTWTEAVDNDLIADIMYYWNGQEWRLVDYFWMYKGYFIWSWVDDLYLFAEPNIVYASAVYFNGTENMTYDNLIVMPESDYPPIYADNIQVRNYWVFKYRGENETYGYDDR